jgi:hypothetical protein
MEECVRSAYRLTAKQIASWSIVTMFGFPALAVSPFHPVVFFGILRRLFHFVGIVWGSHFLAVPDSVIR